MSRFAGILAFAAPLKVACIGDSITEGTGLRNPAAVNPRRGGALASTPAAAAHGTRSEFATAAVCPAQN